MFSVKVTLRKAERLADPFCDRMGRIATFCFFTSLPQTAEGRVSWALTKPLWEVDFQVMQWRSISLRSLEGV